MTDEILDKPESQGNLKDIDAVIENGYEFQFGKYIEDGWELAKKNLGIFVAYTLLFGIMVTIASFIPFGALLIVGPATAGFYIAANLSRHNEKLEFGDFFKGFDFFVPLLLATLVTGILQAIGFILLIIPGIYLAIAYMLVIPIILFHRKDFWQSMEYSRKVITKKWFHFFGFMIVLGLINMLGFIALGIGILITYPVTMCAAYCAFEDILGANKYESPQK